jgi:hypothetical protein
MLLSVSLTLIQIYCTVLYCPPFCSVVLFMPPPQYPKTGCNCSDFTQTACHYHVNMCLLEWNWGERHISAPDGFEPHGQLTQMQEPTPHLSNGCLLTLGTCCSLSSRASG